MLCFLYLGMFISSLLGWKRCWLIIQLNFVKVLNLTTCSTVGWLTFSPSFLLVANIFLQSIALPPTGWSKTASIQGLSSHKTKIASRKTCKHLQSSVTLCGSVARVIYKFLPKTNSSWISCCYESGSLQHFAVALMPSVLHSQESILILPRWSRLPGTYCLASRSYGLLRAIAWAECTGWITFASPFSKQEALVSWDTCGI